MFQTLVSALVMVAFFALARVLLPARELATTTESEVQALREAYGVWNWIGYALSIWYLLIGSYICYEVLGYMERQVASGLGSCRYLLMPNNMYRLIASLAVGVAVSALMTYVSLKVLLSGRYSDFVKYLNVTFRFNIAALSTIFGCVTTVVAALLIVGALNTYMMIGEDNVVLQRPWWQHPCTYSYSQVVGLARFAKYRAPIGVVSPYPYGAIRFDDGETWISGTILYKSDDAKSQDVFDYVCTKTGKTMERLDLLENWKP